MFELTLSYSLELIFILIVSFIVIVFLKGLAMESIWGDPLVDEKSESTNKNSEEEISEENLQEISDKLDFEQTSSDEEEFKLYNSDVKRKPNNKEVKCTLDYDINESASDEENLFHYNKSNKQTNIDITDGVYSKENITDVKSIVNEEDTASFSSQDLSSNIESQTQNQKYIISVPNYINLNENASKINVLDLFKSNKMSRMYEVNGSSFVESEPRSSYDDDELTNYELYKMDGDTADENENWSSHLEVVMQVVPQGVVINNNVFLWDAQWHTMAPVDSELFHCALCRIYTDRRSCEEHVKTEAHLRNLEKYKPLKRFDLSIVRKMNTILHCGVCNVTYDVTVYKDHENSKTHEENLLTAINKVSDLMYDSNVHSDAYGARQFHSSDRNMSNVDRNTSNVDRNVSNVNRNMTNLNRTTKNTGEYHFDANAINNNNINVYEDYSDDDDKEEELEEEEVEEYVPPCQGISYASMARKPTIQLPKFLKIDLGTKEVRVQFDSWHMIVRIESNKYYCMVCNHRDHLRYKSRHCVSCLHVEKLSRCAVVRAFEDYLIRKVDDKLYHCGHCNNLQYQDQMEHHIESTHPKKHRNYVESTTTINQPTKLANRRNIQPKRTESDKTQIVNRNLELQETNTQELFRTHLNLPQTKIDPNFDIFGDIPLSPFGCTLHIPALYFNLIMKKEGGYYCAICDSVCADVSEHVEDICHVELMTMTPFIKPFQNNLTRAVRGMFHCSLCNELFPISKVTDHNIDQPHTNALAVAMGMKKTQKSEVPSKKTIKSTINNKNEAKIGQTALQLPLNLLNKLPENVVQKDFFIKSQLNDNLIQNLGQNSAQMIPRHSSNLGINIPAQELDNYRRNAQEFQSKLHSSNPGQNLQNSESMSPSGYQGSYQKKPEGVPSLLQTAPSTDSIPKQSLIGQKQQYTSQTLSSGQNSPNIGKITPNTGQTLPSGLKHANSIQNSFPAKTIKSIPPMFNPMFPPLPPVNTKSLNQQFMGAPLTYNIPRPNLPPFPNISPINSPKILSPNHQNQFKNNNYNPAQESERKTLIITNRKDSENGSVKMGDNIKTDNSRRNSEKSTADNSRCNSDNSKSAADNSSRNSVDFNHGNNNNEQDKIDSQSEEEELKEFDEEEMVFIKFKTTYFKITNMAYNTLMFLDNGVRYCFVCSRAVPVPEARAHVEARGHVTALSDAKFLDKYGGQLLRQMYLMYHCAICNVVMSRKEIKLHLEWAPHVETYSATHLVLNKKNRKELKSGLKEYAIETQKEAIYRNVNEPNYVVRAAYLVVRDMDTDKVNIEPAKKSKPTATRKNQMVIQDNVVMKIPFEHWHGISTAKNQTKCILCQVELNENGVLEHVETEYHSVSLGKTFDKAYYPALIRKINDNTVNCMCCNLELCNIEEMIHEHCAGRKHAAHREQILIESARSDSYADCTEHYINL